jgi:hypothetical protein
MGQVGYRILVDGVPALFEIPKCASGWEFFSREEQRDVA